MNAERAVFSLKGLSVVFSRGGRTVRALRSVDLDIPEGRILGIVGESGSGKTTLAHVLLGLCPPTEGCARYRDADIYSQTVRKRALFCRDVQLVFQDPYSALNPRMTIGGAIAEVLRVHRIASRRDAPDGVRRCMEQVELSYALAGRYPHELSGGQRQRAVLARALALEPRVLIADEPTSALDVIVQAQILRLLRNLQQQQHITLVLISHDLAVVRQLCDEVAVLKDGQVVEQGGVDGLYGNPTTDYTRELLEAVPRLD